MADLPKVLTKQTSERKLRDDSVIVNTSIEYGIVSSNTISANPESSGRTAVALVVLAPWGPRTA